MIREKIEKLLKEVTGTKAKVEHPADARHGDYSTNVAMMAKLDPKEIIREIGDNPMFEKVEAAGLGFINFFLSKEYLQKEVGEILKKGDKFGQLDIGKGKKIQVEFISANPTGPLTLGNGRGGFCGDTLANVFKKAGFKVEREYYVNDRGEQVLKLGHSVIGDSQAVYQGDYIEGLKKRIKVKDPEKVGLRAAEIILKEMLKPTIKKMGVRFDNWFSERSLYQRSEVQKTLDWLKKKDLAYRKEGALWFRSSRFGDDKDRVLVKADGEKTYFASDIAYLKNKFKRGFNKLIYFWGADHYGYIGRMKAAVEALGYKKEQADFIIMQLVHLFEKGKEIKMSKRTGAYLTLDELIDEVGADVARFFFLTRSFDTHLNFDLGLAKEQSEKNPVYYIQYANARIHSILAKSKIQIKNKKLGLLNHASELALMKQLIRFPDVVEDIVQDYQVQRLPNYTQEVARKFHDFYENCRVLSEDKRLAQARLALISATKIILKNVLDLMGISAPEKM